MIYKEKKYYGIKINKFILTLLNPNEYKLLFLSKIIECFNPEQIFKILKLSKFEIMFG
jgi:hypothetical protein